MLTSVRVVKLMRLPAHAAFLLFVWSITAWQLSDGQLLLKYELSPRPNQHSMDAEPMTEK
jgi:hypothetical protein